MVFDGLREKFNALCNKRFFFAYKIQEIIKMYFIGGIIVSEHIPYFKISARLNRKRFVKRNLVSFGILLLVLLVQFAVMGIHTEDIMSGNPVVQGIYLDLLSAPFILYSMLLDIQRWHDLDAMNFLILGSVLCILNSYIGTALGNPGGFFEFSAAFLSLAVNVPLFFFKGTDGTNRYGADPVKKDVTEIGSGFITVAEEQPPLWQKFVLVVISIYLLSVVISIAKLLF